MCRILKLKCTKIQFRDNAPPYLLTGFKGPTSKQWRRHGMDMSTPLLLEVAPEIDTKSDEVLQGGGRSASRPPL